MSGILKTEEDLVRLLNLYTWKVSFEMLLSSAKDRLEMFGLLKT